VVPAQTSTLTTRNQPSHFQAGEFSRGNGSRFSEFLQPQVPTEEGQRQSLPVPFRRLWAALHRLPSPSPQLIFTGLQAQTSSAEESRPEGSTLYIQCPYAAPDDYQQQKAWCRMRDRECELLVETTTGFPYRNWDTSGKVTIEDNRTNRTVSVTMTNLQVEDSGIYLCAYHNRYGYHQLKTILLNVFKGEYLFPHTNSSLVRKQHHSFPCSDPSLLRSQVPSPTPTAPDPAQPRSLPSPRTQAWCAGALQPRLALRALRSLLSCPASPLP